MSRTPRLASRFPGAALAVAALSLSACYSPAIEDGAQACSADGKCAEGFTCFPDNRCHKAGGSPTCQPACAGATPVCDPGTLKCVQCLADKECPDGQVCSAKACAPGCNAGHPSCGADAGRCDVDLGRCRGCNADAECGGATPRCDVPSGLCVPCLPDKDNCTAGKYCAGKDGKYSCVDGCANDAACVKMAMMGGDGGVGRAVTCCGNRCVDTTSDKGNCGGCGRSCAGAQSCCNGQCIDLSTSLANCGACGSPCTPKNVGTGSCAMGRCGFDKCTPGFGDCDGNPGNGCELPVVADVMNCGACGMTCPAVARATSACVAGSCAVGMCDNGFSDCDKQVGNGCEVASGTDVKNCGGCSRACVAGANQTVGCVAGICRPVCKPGFGDCDGNPGNGCEANFLTDPQNCSACGMRCTVANGVAGCAAGACTVASCNMPFQNCNNVVNDGCEVNTSTDAKNCGRCANPCGVNTPLCVASVCTAQAFKSCKAILDAGAGKVDGVYQVDPDGAGGNAPFNLYCDMTTDGGGWDVQAYIRKPAQWDWAIYSDNGVVGDTASGFSSSATLQKANASYNEKIITFLNLVENNVSVGKQFLLVRRADNVAIPYNTIDANANGWTFRDSFGKTEANAGSVCSHGCATFRGHGMFHDNTGLSWHGTQGGDLGCRDGNNICWATRMPNGCNVGAGRCAYITGANEGVIYGVRNK